MVLGLGGVAYYILRHWPGSGGVTPTTTITERVTTSTLVAGVTTGMVHIESVPTGATAFVDGRPYGKTPIDVHQLAVGDPHEVKLELDGSTPWTQPITITAAQPRAEVRARLVPLPPAVGTADVRSTPPGAQIKVDGAPAGLTTPATLDKLKPGPHQFDITTAGYEPWSKRVAVAAGRTARVEAVLVPVATPRPPVITKSTTPAPPVAPADDPRIYNTTDLDAAPKKISCKSPEFPREAPTLKPGQRASVTLSFVVLESGDVTDVQIVESAGSLLDEAVSSAFRTCKYTPGTKQGAKKKVRLQIRHTFLGA